MKTKLLIPMIVAAMVIFGPIKSYAQHEVNGQMFIPSPDVWSFMKYGNTPTDLYRGVAHTQIPIYTYKDADFELPISVEYASSGFIPNVPIGTLGLGWILNAGGSITREVRQVPDDLYGENGVHLRGYSYYYANDKHPSLDSLMNLMEYYPHIFGIYTYYRNGGDMETTSDIYHFKFGEHSGSFMLDGPNNTCHVFAANHPSGEYKIDVSKFATMGPRKIITITTGDGYKYVFGDHENSYMLDHTTHRYGSTVNNNNSYDFKTLVDYSFSFMLTDIIAPNGRTISLKYQMSGGYIDPFTPSLNTFHFCRPYAHNSFFSQVYNPGTPVPWDSSGSDYSVKVGRQYGIRLKEIDIDNGKVKVNFTYGSRAEEYFKLADNDDSLDRNAMLNLGRLEQIAVKEFVSGSNGNTIMSCSFTYTTSVPTSTSTPTSNPVTFLSSLNISGRGSYGFTYYDSGKKFPFHGTSSIDHWGYYNGDGSGSDTYNAKKLIPLSPNPVNQREPRFEGAKMGMLEQITYPTGGRTKFEYESNSYEKRVIRNFGQDGGYPSLAGKDQGGGYQYPINKPYPAGGVRIRKIMDYSDSIPSTERTFEYTDPATDINSGILLHYPAYEIFYWRGTPPNQSYWFNNIISGSSLLALSMDHHHVGYSTVKENFSDGSSNVYYFSNYGEPGFSDVVDTGRKFILYESNINFSGWYREPISYHNERGKLLKKESYNSYDSLVQKIENIYNINAPKKYSECIAQIPGVLTQPRGFGAYIRKTLVSDYLLVEQKVTDYLSNGSIVTSEKYQYNTLGQTKRIERSRNNNDFHITKFTYLNDQPSFLPSLVMSRMNNVNVVQYPLETQRAYKPTSGSSEITTDAQRVIYNQWGTSTVPRPQKIQKAIFPVGSDYYDDVVFDSYDSNGNLLEQTDKNGIKTSYVWGYGGLYPVAVVENASRNALGISTTSPFAGALSDTREDSLRNLTGTSVTTYKHKPFVGVSEIKDDSRRAIKYTYDSYGRLSAMRDDQGSQGNLLQEFAYTISRNSNIRTTSYTAATQTPGEADNYKDFDFYDGLGYLSQKISAGASPAEGMNIITPIYYDNMRRESRKYLPYAAANTGPYVTSATALSNQQAFYDDIYGDDADGYSYTENVYEASPLNRVTAAFNVGNVFRTPNNEKKSTFVYATNTTDEVMLFKVDSGGALTRSASWFYIANTLHKNTVTNEDGVVSTTYTDLPGRVVMERVVNGSTNYDTYYVYDIRGNLCYVLPPKLVDLKTPTGASLSDSDPDMKALAYVYKYDGRNRCIEKHLPGAESVYMVYDRGDRLVMTQDGNQRSMTSSPQQWLFNSYDNLNRLVSQILVSNTGSVSLPNLRNHFNSYTNLPTGFSTVAVLIGNTYGN